MIQVLLDGCAECAALAALWAAFALVYWSTHRVLCIALGGIYAATPYIVAQWRPADPLSVAPITIAVCFGAAMSVAAETFCLWPLAKRFATVETSFLVNLGLFVIAENAIQLIWGPENRAFATAYTGFSLGRFFFSTPQIGMAISGAAVLAGGVLFLRTGPIGIRARALSDDPELLSLLGARVRVYRSAIFGVAGSFIAVVALLKAVDVGFDPFQGLRTPVVGHSWRIHFAGISRGDHFQGPMF